MEAGQDTERTGTGEDEQMRLNDWKREAEEYRDVDRAILEKLDLAAHQCPRHKTPLLPVAYAQDTYGCGECKETWYLPKA